MFEDQFACLNMILHLWYKINRSLNVLTTVQAMLAPMTFIAGIYGMNFGWMRELHWPYAYVVCLGLLATIAVVDIWIFYRQGWFE